MNNEDEYELRPARLDMDTKFYDFVPKPDITVYELAQLFELCVREHIYNGLSDDMKRHFQEAMTEFH